MLTPKADTSQQGWYDRDVSIERNVFEIVLLGNVYAVVCQDSNNGQHEQAHTSFRAVAILCAKDIKSRTQEITLLRLE